MSRPACTIRPALCTSSPAMMRRSVVLPQPEGPRKQMSSPARTARLTSFRATKLPNSLRMCSRTRKSGAEADKGAMGKCKGPDGAV